MDLCIMRAISTSRELGLEPSEMSSLLCRSSCALWHSCRHVCPCVAFLSVRPAGRVHGPQEIFFENLRKTE